MDNIFMTGLSTTLFGMVGIFVVLIILVLVTMVISKIVDRGENASKSAKQVAAPVVKQDVAAGNIVAPGISPQIVAAITAAVYAMNETKAPLRFVSIKRVAGSTQSMWSNSGNAEIIRTRQQFL